MKKKVIIYILLITLTSFITIKETYAYFTTNFKVNVSSTSSNVICDAVISDVSPSEKSKLGYSEFKVTVKNYDESNELTRENINYTLVIENKNNSNGEFGYNNIFSNGNGLPQNVNIGEDDIQIVGQMSNDSTIDNEYIIQVKTPSGTTENVSYKVMLKCSQAN